MSDADGEIERKAINRLGAGDFINDTIVPTAERERPKIDARNKAATGANPAPEKSSSHGFQELACSHRPWMKRTGEPMAVMACTLL